MLTHSSANYDVNILLFNLQCLPESLLGVRHGKELADGQQVGPGEHQDEEHAGGVKRGQLVLHDVMQQTCDLQSPT